MKTDYPLLIEQVKALLQNQKYLITLLSNTSALLKQSMDDLNWLGFYLYKDEKLILGPFQGLVACQEIQIGKGVCGTAVEKGETILVEDVHQFPGHIACDSASNSEIVIPIFVNGTIWGVLDIDSPLFSRFDLEDKENLEKIVKLLEVAIESVEK